MHSGNSRRGDGQSDPLLGSGQSDVTPSDPKQHSLDGTPDQWLRRYRDEQKQQSEPIVLKDLTKPSEQKEYNQWFAKYYGKTYFNAACWMLEAREGSHIETEQLLEDFAKSQFNDEFLAHAQIFLRLYKKFEIESRKILKEDIKEVEKQAKLKLLLGVYVAAQEQYLRENVKFEYSALPSEDDAFVQSAKVRAGLFFSSIIFGAIAFAPVAYLVFTPPGWFTLAALISTVAIIGLFEVAVGMCSFITKAAPSYLKAIVALQVPLIPSVIASFVLLGLLSNPFTAIPTLAVSIAAGLGTAIFSLASLYGAYNLQKKARNSKKDLAKKGLSEALATARAIEMGKNPVNVSLKTEGMGKAFTRNTKSLKVNPDVIEAAEAAENTGRSAPFDTAVTAALMEAGHITPYIKRRVASNANTKEHKFTAQDDTTFSIFSAAVAFPFGAKKAVRTEWLERNIRDMVGRLFLKAITENQSLYENMDGQIQVTLLYNTILTSLMKEDKLPYSDNNTRFILEIKKAVENVANELDEKPITVNVGGQEKTFTPKLVYTNHAVNKRRNWSIATEMADMNNRSGEVLLEGVAQFAQVFAADDFTLSLSGSEVKHVEFKGNATFDKLDPAEKGRLQLKFQAASALRIHLNTSGTQLPRPGANLFKNALEDMTADATWVGCKSARDRTAHQLASIVVLMQNPGWFKNPPTGKEFIDAVNAEIETGYYLQMSYGSEKIELLGKDQTRENSFVYKASEIPEVVVEKGLLKDKKKKSDLSKEMKGDAAQARGWVADAIQGGELQSKTRLVLAEGLNDLGIVGNNANPASSNGTAKTSNKTSTKGHKP